MPRTSLSFALLLTALTALTLGACGDNLAASRPDAGAPPDGGSDSGSGTVQTPGVGLVVVNSDFASTSISLLDRSTGQVTRGDCIDSGARPPGVTQPLTGDVVVPSWPQPGPRRAGPSLSGLAVRTLPTLTFRCLDRLRWGRTAAAGHSRPGAAGL